MACDIRQGYIRLSEDCKTRIEQGCNPCYHKVMAKVTSKLQLTVPKAIADQYGIKPGDELEWVPAGDSIRVELVRRKARAGGQLTAEERLALFDDNMKRADQFQAKELEEARNRPSASASQKRGWTREELYNDDRGLPRGFPRRH